MSDLTDIYGEKGNIMEFTIDVVIMALYSAITQDNDNEITRLSVILSELTAKGE